MQNCESGCETIYNFFPLQLLKHMLADRSDSYVYLLTHFQQLTEKSPSQAKPASANQLESLVERWTAVQATAITNQAELDALLATSGDFQAQLEAFTDWLDEAERNLGHLETVGCNELGELGPLLQQLQV